MLYFAPKFNQKFILITLIITIIINAFFTSCKNAPKPPSELSPAQKNLLIQSGIKTTGRVFILKNETPNKAFYAFQTTYGKNISQKLEISSDDNALLPNGFPLSDRDEFEVIYLADDPQVNQINYNEPTQLQIQNYLRLAAATEVAKHPDKKSTECMCKVFNTEQLRGWQSTAHIYHQGEKSIDNTFFNEESYRKLYEDAQLNEFIAQRCKAQ
jgi:hypothetical protein